MRSRCGREQRRAAACGYSHRVVGGVREGLSQEGSIVVPVTPNAAVAAVQRGIGHAEDVIVWRAGVVPVSGMELSTEPEAHAQVLFRCHSRAAEEQKPVCARGCAQHASKSAVEIVRACAVETQPHNLTNRGRETRVRMRNAGKWKRC